MFAAVRKKWGGVDVLINNAGMGYRAAFTQTDAADWREVLDVNVLALSICIREAIQDMKGRQDAAIINISSIAGHRVPPGGRGYTFYAASKHAVRAITEGLRDELAAKGVHIKLGTVSPGMVETEFQQVATRAEAKPAPYADYRVLDPGDVAQAALFMLATPRHVQISDIVMRSVEQPH
jgi:NADP-dependent 3-hydroxy acid dehydrogenase YdfG